MQKTLEEMICERIRQNYAAAAEQTCKDVLSILHAGRVDSTEVEIPTEKILDDEESQVVKICKTLRILGCDPSLKGYRPLAYAILCCYKKPELQHQIIKSLYPTVAEKYNSTSTKIERTLRHTINKMYPYMKTDVAYEIFGESVSKTGWSPTNSQFLASMVDYLIEHKTLCEG